MIHFELNILHFRCNNLFELLDLIPSTSTVAKNRNLCLFCRRFELRQLPITSKPELLGAILKLGRS